MGGPGQAGNDEVIKTESESGCRLLELERERGREGGRKGEEQPVMSFQR